MSRFERRALTGYVLLMLFVVMPYAGMRAWQLVGEPYPGLLIQPLLNVSPYDPDRDTKWRLLLLKVDGQPVSESDQILDLARQKGVGETLTFEGNRLDRIVTFTQQVRPFTAADFLHGFVVPTGAGVPFLGIALFLLWRRADSEQAIHFAYACAALGTFLVLYCDFNLEQRLLWLSFLPYGALGWAFLAFAHVFPTNARPTLPWSSRLPLAIGITAGLLLTASWYGLPHADPDSLGYALLHLQLFAGTLNMAVAVTVLLVLALLRLRRAEALARQQVVLMFAGVAAAFAPFALGWALPEVIWQRHFINYPLTVTAFGTFPLFVAYGIVRHQLFDVQVIVRRSMTYLLVLSLLSAAYYLLVLATGYLLLDHLAANLGVTLALALLFQPLKATMQRLVDHVFFRETYDVQAVIEYAAEAMAKQLDIQHLLATLEALVRQTLHPEGFAVLLLDDTGQGLIAVSGHGELAGAPTDLSVACLAKVARDRQIVSRALLPTAKPHQVRKDLSADLLVPLLVEDRLVGVILLGERKSHTRYRDPDLTLLTTLSRQAALALVNAQKHEQIQQLNASLESRIAQRTQDLEQALQHLRQTQAQLVHNEKMASLGLLVAGMAHEINNPITIVHSSVEMIEDYLQDLWVLLDAYELVELDADSRVAIDTIKRDLHFDSLRHQLPRLAESGRDASRRIRQIIADLSAFSGGQTQTLVTTATLAKILEASVNLCRALFKGRIRFECKLDGLPDMTVQAGQIGQVVGNLLVNAAQATDDTGVVTLTATVEDEGLVLAVHDRGRGIPAAIQGQIFDPFFTTKPTGEGMGLGLAISHALVSANQGWIDVESTTGNGTTFRVHLPVVAPAAEAVTDT